MPLSGICGDTAKCFSVLVEVGSVRRRLIRDVGKGEGFRLFLVTCGSKRACGAHGLSGSLAN